MGVLCMTTAAFESIVTSLCVKQIAVISFNFY